MGCECVTAACELRALSLGHNNSGKQARQDSTHLRQGDRLQTLQRAGEANEGRDKGRSVPDSRSFCPRPTTSCQSAHHGPSFVNPGRVTVHTVSWRLTYRILLPIWNIRPANACKSTLLKPALPSSACSVCCEPSCDHSTPLPFD